MIVRMIASVVIAALLMTGGAVAASPVTEYGVQPVKDTIQATLTQVEAEDIALAHAGLTRAEVTGLHSEYDVDRGIPEWDIDFRSGDWEYDYEVSAHTGEVLKHKKDYDPEKAPAVKQEKPAETQPKAQKLTAEEAKAIALKHAGLTADQVRGLRAEYDRDDGVPEWEVEFYSGNMEYDYEIHAETGKILFWDKERDD